MIGAGIVDPGPQVLGHQALERRPADLLGTVQRSPRPQLAPLRWAEYSADNTDNEKANVPFQLRMGWHVPCLFRGHTQMRATARTKYVKYLRLYLPMVLLAGVASAATFTVTKESDDDGPCDPDDCALREAILAANALPGADTVLLPSGTYPLTLVGPVPENEGRTGDLDIRDDLELLGDPDQLPVIIGDGTDRVIDIGLETVELARLVITGGVGTNIGGGIRASGSLTLRDSEIVGNSTFMWGGGLSFCCGNATIVGSTFENNTAQFQGGGIHNIALAFGQSTQLINSTVVGNHAPIGGGVMIVDVGSFDLINSTIADNTSIAEFGSGVAWETNSVSFSNTVLSNNTCSLLTGIPPDTNGHNMEGPSDTCFPPGTDQSGVTDVGLGPLADHGGPTRTMPLLPGSPALDSALLTDCPMADQRGVRRPQGVGCDVGAFEREVPPVVEVPALGTYRLLLLAGLLAVVGVFYVKQKRRCLF
jgi:CSLREA domain-containing protein